MLRLHSRSTRRGGANRLGGLKCERLETRDCPAAPALLSFNVSRGTGHNIQVSGVVLADNPTAVHVDLSGVASGSFTPNAAGFFNGSSVTNGFGQIAAQAFDSGGSSSISTSDYQNLAPQIQLSTVQTGAGSVHDQRRRHRRRPKLDHRQFDRCIRRDGSAQCDWQLFDFVHGQHAWHDARRRVRAGRRWFELTAGLLAAQSTPGDHRFPCGASGRDGVDLAGQRPDEAPAGLTVLFHGGLAEIDNHTATVMSDGSFSAVFYLKIGESGSVSAQTQDWFGLGSNIPTTFVG